MMGETYEALRAQDDVLTEKTERIRKLIGRLSDKRDVLIGEQAIVSAKLVALQLPKEHLRAD